MKQTMILFAQQREGKLSSGALCALGTAQRLAAQADINVKALMLGDDIVHEAEALLDYGVEEVLLGEASLLRHYQCETYTQAILQAVEQTKPDIIAFAGVDTGYELAAGVARGLNTTPLCGCTNIARDAQTEKLIFTTTSAAKQVHADYEMDASPTVIVLADGAQGRAAKRRSNQGVVKAINLTINNPYPRVEVMEEVVGSRRERNLSQSKLIVAGGRGMGNQEGFASLGELAEVLGGEVGATRAAVSSGWVGDEKIIGLSGTTVSPDVYIACGVNGAMQHVEGMESSALVISINTNDTAPIFGVSDFSIVGDARTIVPKLIDGLKERLAH